MGNALLGPIPLRPGEGLVKFFDWDTPLGVRPFAVTTHRILQYAIDPQRGDYSWQSWYEFPPYNRATKAAEDKKHHLYIDLDPGVTLRFDGSTIQEV